ncbi:hypothetical protein [Actinokineospora sp. NBRC 105648]|uniref:hypothetical protein n=1 Tax=Actinokineospora sp. NBRC 105648 TaxID=3032206 RepID=UPI0025528245|nr:hypothetical protein [Actinokineospora sp. NBRC 105648]
MIDKEEKQKIALQALISEAARLGDAIAERHAAAERFVAVTGAFLGIGLTLGLFQNQKTVLLALPVTILIILIYMIQIYTDAGMHSGHRQALEARLQTEFGYPLLVGQSRVAAGYARRTSVIWTLGLVGIIWLSTAVGGGWAVFQLWQQSLTRYLVLIGYLTTLALALFGVRLAIRENAEAENEAQRVAEDSWAPTNKIIT